jgi:hypothetical protein
VKIVLIAAAVGVLVIFGTALILPCPACRKRRERLRAAYAEWKAKKPS